MAEDVNPYDLTEVAECLEDPPPLPHPQDVNPYDLGEVARVIRSDGGRQLPEDD